MLIFVERMKKGFKKVPKRPYVIFEQSQNDARLFMANAMPDTLKHPKQQIENK